MTSILDGALDRAPFEAEGGRTGAAFERAVLAGGTPVVIKHVTPEDWIARMTGDSDRVHRMWTDGLYARLPPSIDHAIIAMERDSQGWIVVMRDISEAILPDDRVLTREENDRVLRAVDEMHAEFLNEPIEGLTTLYEHYACMIPDWVRKWAPAASPVKELIPRGWELFSEVAPRDVVDAMTKLLDDPAPLVRELEKRPATLLHGDVRLHNLGLTRDRVVLFDWEIAGPGPAAVDVAWFLIISASRIDATPEQVVDAYAQIAGDRWDAHAFDLACIGALLRLGWNKALDIVENPDEGIRAQERADLDWWIARVRRSLEAWSPANAP